MTTNFLCLDDFESVAARRLPHSVYGYIKGGAEECSSVSANRAAFSALSFRTRILQDTSSRSCAVTTLGQEWAAPFGIAPMGAMGVAAFQADLIMARAAARANIPFVLSGSSLVSMERVIHENPAAWFQAYLSAHAADNDVLIRRVEQAGFRTLVLTVDVPVAGNRENDIRNGYTSPPRPSIKLAADGLLHPGWLFGTFLRSLLKEGMPHFENFGSSRAPMMSFRATRVHRRDNLSWEVLKRIREQWRHRIVLKGVLSTEDIQLAREAGIEAVIVSNHGGRQLDGAVSPLDILAANAVQGQAGVELLCDSGIRRGTDILKAVALGASHVFVGRPFLYAAVAGGEAGVLRAIELLRAELLRNMAMLGCTVLSRQTLRPLLVMDRGVSSAEVNCGI